MTDTPPTLHTGPTHRLDTAKLLTARMHAVKVRPYLADALFALHVVEDWAVPTMAVDMHWRCYVSPGFVDRTPVEELAGVWVHEVCHLLRDHHGRSQRYAAEHGEHGPGERLRHNIAADFEINDDIYGDGLPQPTDAIVPSLMGLPEGLLMEQYLNRASLSDLARDLAWLECGSGADGHQRPWELGPDGANGLTRQQRDAVRFRVAEGINGRPGTAPDGWRRWAQRVFHQPQPWRHLLGAAVRSAVGTAGGSQNHSYRRPSRRAAGVPKVVLPRLVRQPPKVCVVIDTSGSVSDTELGIALVEVAAISRAVGGRRGSVSVISCDAAAGVAAPLCQEEDIELIGGGGTDLRSGFARAMSSRPRPEVVVALTDGHTPWPATQPPCKTVVGLFRRPVPAVDEDNPHYYQPDPPPPWARVVTIGLVLRTLQHRQPRVIGVEAFDMLQQPGFSGVAQHRR
ncbi:putative metal-dependent peptidase [Stackebrandtia endophytica]|uniref:Putative metal-dependent peptidase n=1 Tax=Stackebrandtia endophytica TaxID=1496996 RepID=A0A543B0Y4_9ACTN|nr:VWA-like domain-containing protein [Stackebrandtia endophytica]TQL78497.1 putative metal-dependent peptidase [Stackebrandtia endophytica]